MIAIVCNIGNISTRIKARTLPAEGCARNDVSLAEGLLEGVRTILVSGSQERPAQLSKIESIITHFDVKILIHIDSAYPIVPYLQHGDMVVANTIRVYRPDGSPRSGRYSPDPDESTSCPDRSLIVQVVKAYETLFSGKSNRPELLQGRVVTVEDWTMDKKSLPKLHRDIGGLAIDRDGAYLEDLCRACHIPLLLLRVMVDSDEKEVNSNFTTGLNLISERVTDLIVEVMAAGMPVPILS